MSIEDSAAKKLQHTSERRSAGAQSYDLRVLSAAKGVFGDRQVEESLLGINAAAGKMTAREAQLAANTIREYISNRGSIPEALKRRLDVTLGYLNDRMQAAKELKSGMVVSLKEELKKRQGDTDERLREVRRRLDFEENRPMAQNGAFDWVDDEKMRKARDIEKVRAAAKKEKSKGPLGFIKGLFGS
jgi:hypothetical protein